MPETHLPYTPDAPKQIARAAARLGLSLTEHPHASRPSERHWHLKFKPSPAQPKKPGTIELTWRPETKELVLIVRPHRQGLWTPEAIQELASTLSSPDQPEVP